MLEKMRDAVDMDVFAVVRGAGQRQFFVAQPEAVDGARTHHGQGLHRLDRRARKHRPGNIARGGDDIAFGVRNHEGAAMAVLDEGAARLLDEDGVGVQN